MKKSFYRFATLGFAVFLLIVFQQKGYSQAPSPFLQSCIQELNKNLLEVVDLDIFGQYAENQQT